MKRRYKEGDWFRISLDANVDALGIITRACRSRLFGYFFAAPAAEIPAHDDLKRLRAADAAACALFGGAPLEEVRWNIIATSVPFDREAWPFPQFVSRGAFGRVWTRRVYDPETLQVTATETIDEPGASGLPDARFAGAGEQEAFLRERICGDSPREPLSIYEVHTGFDPASLHILSRGGRIQFSEPISAEELEIIARFIERHSDVELRVHGFSTRAFDIRSLSVFSTLRALTLDVHACVNLAALITLTQLHRLRIGTGSCAALLDMLPKLPALRELEVHGSGADVASIAQCEHLDQLALINTPPVELSRLASAPVMRELTIAHVAQPLDGIAALKHLTRLELRDMRLPAFPNLSHNEALQTVALRNIREMRVLAPVAAAPALRELQIAGMPQLNVADFAPFVACANLNRVHVEIGSRTKAREVYRFLHLGKRQHEVFRH